MSTKSTQADRDLIRDLDGFYIGQLEPHEVKSLNRCVADGLAIRDYGEILGQFGLGKVRWLPQREE